MKDLHYKLSRSRTSGKLPQQCTPGQQLRQKPQHWQAVLALLQCPKILAGMLERLTPKQVHLSSNLPKALDLMRTQCSLKAMYSQKLYTPLLMRHVYGSKETSVRHLMSVSKAARLAASNSKMRSGASKNLTS